MSKIDQPAGVAVDRPVRPSDEAINKAVHEAVSAIYFADSSDYLSALWSVLRLLAPGLSRLLETDEARAWNTSDDWANARPNASFSRPQQAGTK